MLSYLAFVAVVALIISVQNAVWSARLAEARSRHATRAQPTSRSSWALAEGWTPPKYSTHTCIGQKFDDAWQMATCKFDNICLNTSTLEFEYYQDPEYPDTPIAHSQWGRELHDEFSEHLLHPAHALEDHRKHGWRPVVVRRSFPQPGRWVKWAPQSQALLVAMPIKYVYNFGHIVYDVLVPLFNMQHLFGVYTPDAQILVLDRHLNDTLRNHEDGVYPEGDSPKEALIRRMRKFLNTTDPSASMFRLLWDHNAMWPRDYSLKQLGRGRDGQGRDGLICFKSVLAGTGFLSRRMSRVDSLPWRQAVLEHVGVEEAPQEVPVITFFRKEGRRMLENWDEVFSALQRRYRGARLQMVDFGMRRMSLREQAELMSESSILISPCGGIATSLVFLRPGSTAILFNYFHTLRNRSVQMEDVFYKHLEYLDLQYFPVSLKDYNQTRDRPPCELVEGGKRPGDRRYRLSGALVNCNIRLDGRGLQRLVDIVDNAMLRWAARTGCYAAVASLRGAGRFPVLAPSESNIDSRGSQATAGAHADGQQQQQRVEGGTSSGGDATQWTAVEEEDEEMLAVEEGGMTTTKVHVKGQTEDASNGR